MVLKIAELLRRMHREDKGFTLIELLIVIAIIAIIAAIAIPTVVNRIDDARQAADQANVKLLQGLVDLHYIDNGTFPLQNEINPDVNPIGEVTNTAEAGWQKVLVDQNYLLEAVESPYPNVGVEGYTLTINLTNEARPVATVDSTQKDKWDEETPTT